MRATDIDDAKRLADRIWIEYREDIHDEESFNRYFEEYLGDDLTISQDVELRKKTFQHIKPRLPKKKRYKRVIVERKRGKASYTIPARVGKTIVYAAETKVRIRNKEIVKYRDRRGRFVKRLR